MSFHVPESFRDKAETCRSLVRHVTHELTLRVLAEIISGSRAHTDNPEKTLVPHDVEPLRRIG